MAIIMGEGWALHSLMEGAIVPRSRRWTTDIGLQDDGQMGRGTTRWEPTLAFPKTGAHRATLGDRIFAEVHIDVKAHKERENSREGLYGDSVGGRAGLAPFIESVVYEYMGVQDDNTLVLRETSRQGERVERSTMFVRLSPVGPTKVRFASGAVSIAIDDEQVATIRWLGA